MRKIGTPGVRIAAVAALAAATAFPLTAGAERLSLAERVAALEEQAQAGRGNLDLVNQIQALQSQVQQLQGQVEELRHQLDEAKERNKQQYIDLDSRLGRLEGRLGICRGGFESFQRGARLVELKLGRLRSILGREALLIERRVLTLLVFQVGQLQSLIVGLGT